MTINSTSQNTSAVSGNYVLVSSAKLGAAIEKHASLQAKMHGIQQTTLHPETCHTEIACSTKKPEVIGKPDRQPVHRRFSFSLKSGKYSFGNSERKSKSKSTGVTPFQVTPISINTVVRDMGSSHQQK